MTKLSLVSLFGAGLLVMATTYSVAAETKGALPPGSPAGAKAAQLLTTGNLMVAAGVGLVAALVLSSGHEPIYADPPLVPPTTST